MKCDIINNKYVVKYAMKTLCSGANIYIKRETLLHA